MRDSGAAGRAGPCDPPWPAAAELTGEPEDTGPDAALATGAAAGLLPGANTCEPAAGPRAVGSERACACGALDDDGDAAGDVGGDVPAGFKGGESFELGRDDCGAPEGAGCAGVAAGAAPCETLEAPAWPDAERALKSLIRSTVA